MAADDILLKRSQTISSYDDNMLNPYREFEPFVGIRQEFTNLFNSIWYSSSSKYIFDLIYYPDNNTNGKEVLGYLLGQSSAEVPARNKLISKKNYLEDNIVYYILLVQPGVLPHSFIIPYTPEGVTINYKINIFFGWKEGYQNTSIYSNPFFSNMNTLAKLSAGLSNYDPTKLIKSYNFAEVYMRYSRDGILELSTWDGNSLSTYPNINWGWKFYCAHNGISETFSNSFYKGDWINTRNHQFIKNGSTVTIGTNQVSFIIPGNYHDTLDTNTYYIYGICATSHQLSEDAYFDLSNTHHTTKLMMNYLGEDTFNSGVSQSGFLTTASGSPDRRDGLKYIYTFQKMLDHGFTSSNYADYGLILWGLHNNFYRIRIRVSFEITPYKRGSYPYSETMEIWLKYSYNNSTVKITNLKSTAVNTYIGGYTTITIDNTGTTVTGNGTSGTHYSGTASPSSINWYAQDDSTIRITKLQIGGVDYNTSSSYVTLNPTGNYNYISATFNFSHGYKSSTGSSIQFVTSNHTNMEN